MESDLNEVRSLSKGNDRKFLARQKKIWRDRKIFQILQQNVDKKM